MVKKENIMKKLLWLSKIARNILIILCVFTVYNNYRIFTYDYNDQFSAKTEEILFDSREEFETKLNRYDVKPKRVQTTDDSELDGKVKVKLALEIKAVDFIRQYLDLESGIIVQDDLGNDYSINNFDDRYGEDGSLIQAWRYNGKWKKYLYLTLHIPREAKEITVTFDRFGYNFEFTTPVSGGEEHE